MVIGEAARHALHQRLDVVLGREEAATLMSHLPPVGWADVSTKRDLDHLAAVTKRDLDSMANALRAEMADLRTQLRDEMAELRDQLRGEMAELGTEFRTGLADVRAEFHRELTASTRILVFSMVSVMVVLASLAFGAARLI